MFRFLMIGAALAGIGIALTQSEVVPTGQQTPIPDCGFREFLALK